MPRLPRDVSQARAIRALVRAGGVERSVGKGSHRGVEMPNGETIILPAKLKTGTLAAMVRKAGLTVEELIELL